MSTSIILNLPDLTRAKLGQVLFERVYHCTRMAAERYAQDCHRMSVIYDPVTHEKMGYQIEVPNSLTAARVRLAHDLARQCRAMARHTTDAHHASAAKPR